MLRKKRIKEESSSDAASKPETEYRYINVDQAVSNSITQKCVYCKRFGASVKCKASGKFYHWPCATASGSFMYKHKQEKQDIRILVGTDSLEKVSEFCKLLQSKNEPLLIILMNKRVYESNYLKCHVFQRMTPCTCITPGWNGNSVK